METYKLTKTLIKAIHNTNVASIRNIKDFFSNMEKVNISNMDLKVIEEDLEVLSWVVNNAEYDFKSLISSQYSNVELFNYFKLYRGKLLFFIERFNKKQFIITPDDFK